jgi:tRNA nucleotidyltransferase (CCA-adding enzyme)
MQIYLVGGAVRDEQLGIPIRERDWVVVGAAEKELEALGYRRVGRSFPVYLHPETSEEYALARTETKTGPGYRGFEVETSGVTLEDDLSRRDLTINAMALDADGQLIDPFGGRKDLENCLLRHVSDAFREDPVRILRVARFAARFWERGFRVADETLTLMREMVAEGEADSLIPERVWRETESALREARPDVYFEVIREVGALAVIYPEVNALFGVPQPEQWHPEIDTGAHIIMALRQAAALSASAEARFAVLVHDLGKGTTPKTEWPRHVGHEQRGVGLIKTLCDRLGVPNRFRDLAILVARYHGLAHRAAELKPKTVLKMLADVDAFRRPERMTNFLAACEADARGRTGLEDRPYPQATLLQTALIAAQEVTAESFLNEGLEDEALVNAIRLARIDAIRQVQRKTANSTAASKSR